MTPARRARDLGLPFEGETGPDNAITDVRGIAVGATTLIEDAPRPGRARLVNTGVTAIVPHFESKELLPCWAGVHAFNGNGEMTGAHWISDGGWFFGPILLTNTHSVGIAHHAAIRWMIDRYPQAFEGAEALWALPVVAETYDGVLNDINALALEEAHVLAALDQARPGPVGEGNVGGGTGMIAYGHKGGTGTASRRIEVADQEFTVGALVQANHGIAEWLTVCGAPVGRLLAGDSDNAAAERGSIIVVIATDAPLLPHQLARVARRGSLGIGRGGTIGGNNSGDIFLAFTVAAPPPLPSRGEPMLERSMINDDWLDAIYAATVQSIEEAVVNALVAAEDMGGAFGAPRVRRIDHEMLARAVLRMRGEPGS